MSDLSKFAEWKGSFGNVAAPLTTIEGNRVPVVMGLLTLVRTYVHSLEGKNFGADHQSAPWSQLTISSWPSTL